MAGKTSEAAADGERFEDIERMSFEQALGALEEIVRALEDGEIDLDGAIEAYARGAALRRHCEGKLRHAESRISRISVAEDGSVTAVPADDDGPGG